MVWFKLRWMKRIILLFFCLPIFVVNGQKIAGGDFFSVVVCNDGSVKGWGYSAVVNSIVPRSIDSLQNIVAVAGGGSHCLAIRNDSVLFAWGQNSYGQIG